MAIASVHLHLAASSNQRMQNQWIITLTLTI